jgi:UDP-glucuronate decarboxylase
MAKNILITGGTGFLGSHLCKTLLGQGNEIVCLDNNYTGSLSNISDIADKIKFIEHDINNDIIPVLEKYNIAKIDEIYNMACPASPQHYQGKYAIFTTRTCTIGAINVLEVAKKFGARILQASTSEVYGNPNVSPQNESYFGNVNPHGIRSCYDEGKRCAESLFFDYHRQYGIDIRIIRIFNTYGPFMNQNDGRVVSNFICQALTGSDITIYGNGSQTRSFCYVDDLIRGIILMMENKNNFQGPVNLGNPHEMTVKEIAELIISLTKSTSRIIFKPLPSDDPLQRRPDISLAKKQLNWEPSIYINDGLARTIDYFRDLLMH